MTNIKPIVVIKYGTHSITCNNQLNLDAIEQGAIQIEQLLEDYRIIVVSSGAVAAGRSLYQQNGRTCKKESGSIEEKQLMASVGQQPFLQAYQYKYEESGLLIGPCLFTKLDFHNLQHREQSMRTLTNLMEEKNIVPVINENDVTAVDELKFGDNDALAADVAIHMGASRLIYVTHHDGIYTENPEIDPEATLISTLSEMEQIKSCASKSTGGTGGAISKAIHAFRASRVGIEVDIVNVDEKDVLLRLLQKREHIGTHINAGAEELSTYRYPPS